ncbi:MAG: segregation/condensation protein A [Actinomycetota bacterium]|nr:segregation/condensation protein A [Actinomycetota bacterium]
MTHEVKLGEVFEGPIDLLLHLVTRQRVDIYDISLSTITDEYLRAVGELAEVDLEAATGFLVVAATLLELKSARLLPGPDPSENDGLLEERDALLARLVECSTFREAGSWITTMLEEGEAWHPRTAGLEPEFVALAPDLLARLSLQDVARAAVRALHKPPPPQLDTSHVAPIRATVAEAIVDLAERLRFGEVRSFRDLCAHVQDRIEVVVRFLGLLELFKAGAIDLAQATRWGDISVEWTGEVDASDVLADVEDYTLEEAPNDLRGRR